MILATAILLVCISLLIYWKRRSKFFSAIDKIPGPKVVPIFGNVLSLIGPRDEFFPNLFKLLEDQLDLGIARLYFGWSPNVLLFKAEYVECLLNNTKHIDKSKHYKFLLPWLKDGLLTSSGEKWRHRRRILTPAFHFRIMEDFLLTFNEQSAILVKSLQKEVGKESFDIFPYISLAALDMICDSAMGCSINAQTNGKSEYVNGVHTATVVLFKRMVFPWLQPDIIFNKLKVGNDFSNSLKILHGFTKEVIVRRKAEYNNTIKKEKSDDNSQESLYGKKRKLAFLDLLLEYSDEGRVLSDSDIQEEVDTFMFEGHDTTASGMFWSIYFLGLHQEVQQKANEEIKSVIGVDDCPISSDQLKDLKYLEAVVKEALRLCPSVPMIARCINEDFTVGNHVIPSGATVAVMPYILHRDPKQFPDPESFQPERFLFDGPNKLRHPYAYVPFSAGPRNCIGQKFALMEEKTVLAYFLRNYKVSVTNDVTGHQKAVPELVLRPSNRIKVKIENRT